MKRTNMIVMTLALGLAASSLIAQDNARPRRPGPGPGGEGGFGEGGAPHRRMEMHRMPPPPVISAIDANRDGTISADEIANASAALKTLDKDNDGQITEDEMRPPRPEGHAPSPGGERHDPPPQGGQPGKRMEKRIHIVPPMISALDANGDQTISAEEIANASNALKALDRNGDGALQIEELRPEPPPRREN